MSEPSSVALGLVAALSLGALQPAPPAKQSPVKVVNVELIVGTLKEHQDRCTKGGIATTTILVTAGKANEVRYCVKGELLGHDHAHQSFAATLVNVSSGQSIRWVSKATRFKVVQVSLHGDIQKGAPESPFVSPFPLSNSDYSNEVTSPAVVDVKGLDVTQRYKVSFEIETLGHVDPDVVCSM